VSELETPTPSERRMRSKELPRVTDEHKRPSLVWVWSRAVSGRPKCFLPRCFLSSFVIERSRYSQSPCFRVRAVTLRYW
jgi:hypothetical protein